MISNYKVLKAVMPTKCILRAINFMKILLAGQVIMNNLCIVNIVNVNLHREQLKVFYYYF